ncbi:antitoxin [Kribbella sp. WER1]
MNDFQEQAKNWLRNVVKQNPDKIKAGVEKAGDLIDKQTGGKYADKVDAVQQKVGSFVDQQGDEASAQPAESDTTTQASQAEPEAPSSAQESPEAPSAGADPTTSEPKA